jgi:phosphatidylserine decarboxylase
MADDIYYYDRATGERCRETIYGERFVRWAYQDATARGLRGWLLRSALPSRVLGAYFASRLSRGRVRAAIAQLAIDTTEFRDPVASYRSFHQFFVRHLKPEARPFSPDPAVLASPADGRTIAYPCVDGDTAIPVKGARFRVADLLGRETPSFAGGAVVVVRLCPADYHRFHFPCAGQVAAQWDIPGLYHSVNPLALALGINVFPTNRRACCLLETERFGMVAYVEVGAFGVGSIVQTYQGPQVAKMQEKGYFTFGGSTVVLAFQAGRVELAPDLVQHSAEGYETLLKVGQELGRAGAAPAAQ